MNRPYKIFILAGEASGDFLGAHLMHALKDKELIEWCGVGGSLMEKEGLSSFFPMNELSLLGFVEVIPKIPLLLKRLSELESYIHEKAPDVVITIDVPGFSYRLLKRLKGKGIKLIHYVAPTVWVWREGRARKWAQVTDYLMTLFPFEPPYFEKYGGKALFVGHPLLESRLESEDPSSFLKKYDLKETDVRLLVLPGSRQSELKTLVPLFKEAALLFAKAFPTTVLILPAVDHFYETLYESFQSFPLRVIVVKSGEKNEAIGASHLALAASGTVTLEVALRDIPMVVAYKVNAFTAWLIKQVIKVPYVSLVNLLLKAYVVEEYLQKRCTSLNLSKALKALYTHEEKRQAQKEAFQKLKDILKMTQKPSEEAAKIVLQALKEKNS